MDYSAAVKAALGSSTGSVRGGGADREREKLRRLVQEVMQAALLHVEATRGREHPQAVAVVRSTVDSFLSGALESLTLKPADGGAADAAGAGRSSSSAGASSSGSGAAAAPATGSGSGAGAGASSSTGAGGAITGRTYSRVNPKNVENATRLAQLQALNAGLSGELDDWRECIQRYSGSGSGSSSSSAGAGAGAGTGAGAGAGVGGKSSSSSSGGPPTSGTSLFALAEGSGAFDEDDDDDEDDVGVLTRLGIAPTAALASAGAAASSSSAAAAGGAAAAAVVPDHHHQGLAVLLRKGADAARDAIEMGIAHTRTTQRELDTAGERLKTVALAIRAAAFKDLPGVLSGQELAAAGAGRHAVAAASRGFKGLIQQATADGVASLGAAGSGTSLSAGAGAVAGAGAATGGRVATAPEPPKPTGTQERKTRSASRGSRASDDSGLHAADPTQATQLAEKTPAIVRKIRGGAR